MYTKVKTAQEIVNMRVSGQLLAKVLTLLQKKVEPGISTKELADIAARELKALGGDPAFYNYQGYPDVLCTSINDEVVHGIPSNSKILKNGDVLGLDFGVIYNGMITDSAISIIAGNTGDHNVKNLVKNTKDSLYQGIARLKGGVYVGDVANAIESALNKAKLGIVKDLVGHGVGHQLHEDPNIPNFGKKGTGPTLISGMTIAIEPMATLGLPEVYIDKDHWTVKTKDSSLSAHFEHTVLITDNGYEILTELAE